jgi:two-component system cell cycle response regulator
MVPSSRKLAGRLWAAIRPWRRRVRGRVSGAQPHPPRPSNEDTAVASMSEVFGPAAPGSTGPIILVIYGDELGRKHVLDAPETTIGSAPTADIRVTHESVSPRHAVITSDDHGQRIADAGSSDGTWVNDRKLDGPTTLRDGDLVKLGCVVFKFLTGENRELSYHEEMFRRATTDEVTGALEKHVLAETLGRELSRARRHERRLSLVILGIDHLERCNDTFGHHAGDQVLRHTTELVREHARKVDVIGRWHDDELAIVLPDLDLRGATALAEAICRAVERHRFEHEGAQLEVTVSLGVAELEPELAGVDALVDVAEARLHRAKQLGRNRVVASDDDGPSGPS